MFLKEHFRRSEGTLTHEHASHRYRYCTLHIHTLHACMRMHAFFISRFVEFVPLDDIHQQALMSIYKVNSKRCPRFWTT